MNTFAFAALTALAVCRAPSYDGDKLYMPVWQAPREAERTLKVIDVRDLLEADQRFAVKADEPKAPLPSKSALDRWTSGDGQASDVRASAEALAARATALQEIAELWMRPPLEPGKDALLVTPDGKLVAHLTSEGHAWLDAFLNTQRHEHVLIDSQFCFVTGPKARFDSMLPSGGVAFLSDEDAAKLIAEAKRGSDLEIVQSPRVVSWPRQKLNVSTLAQTAYIKEWRIETIEPGRQQIADPHVEILQYGLNIEARAVLLGEQRIGLELVLTQSDLQQPIATKKLTLPIGTGREVEVGEPKLITVRLRTTVALDSKGHALFRGPIAGEGRDVVVLVKAVRVDGTSELEPGGR